MGRESQFGERHSSRSERRSVTTHLGSQQHLESRHSDRRAADYWMAAMGQKL